MRFSLTQFLLFLSLAMNAQSDTWTFFAPPPELTCQAARGNDMLIGSIGGGIVRFDTLGNQSIFNVGNSALPSDTIIDLVIDAAGHWWMLESRGISRIDGSSAQSWTLPQIGLSEFSFIRDIKAAPDTSLYAVSDEGVAIFKNGSWSVLNTSNSGIPTNNIFDVAFGLDGKRYYATISKGIAVQDGADWTTYTSTNTGVSMLNNVYAVAVTTNGTLWAIGGVNANASIRLARFESGTWTGLTAATIGINPSSAPFRKLTAGADGRLYLTTPSSVSIFNQNNWTHFYAQDIGYAPEATIAPVEDGAGHMWVFTSCQLARYDGQTWHRLGAGLPGPPDGTLYDGIGEGADGSMWFGTYGDWFGNPVGGYIARLKNNTWQQYLLADLGASKNHVYCAHGSADGQMWFGLDDALILRYNGSDWTLIDTCAVHFPGYYVINAATAANGDHWFSLSPYTTSKPVGLARLTANGHWTFFDGADTPIPPAPISYLRKILPTANGSIWFATTGAGIYRYNGADWDLFNVSNSALPSNQVYYIEQAPDGAVWAATDAGLARYDGQNWSTLNSSNSGLPSDETRRIAFDKADGMYVGYAAPGTLGARAALMRGGVWTELVPPGWETSSNDEPDAFFVDSQNRLWFAEYYDPGVYRYDPMLVNFHDVKSTEKHLYIYPNPASEFIHLNLLGWKTGQVRVEVRNAQGTLLLEQTQTVTDDHVTLELPASWPTGVYHLEVRDEQKERRTARFVRINAK